MPKFLLFKSNAAKDYRQILPLPGEGIDSNVGNLTSRIGEGCRIIKWRCIEKRKAGKMEGPSNKTAKAPVREASGKKRGSGCYSSLPDISKNFIEHLFDCHIGIVDDFGIVGRAKRRDFPVAILFVAFSHTFFKCGQIGVNAQFGQIMFAAYGAGKRSRSKKNLECRIREHHSAGIAAICNDGVFRTDFCVRFVT